MIRQPPTRVRAAITHAPVHEQFASLQSQLDLLKAQVRQAQQLSTLGTAAAMLAHEVNNLLTPMLGYCQYAIGSNDPTLQQKAFSIVVTNAKMLISMTDRILELSAAKTRELVPVPLRAAVTDAIHSLCRDLSKDGLILEIQVGDTAVLADPLQLRQVLFNLFLNAREAMAQNHSGRLSVTANGDCDWVTIQIRDTGQGIPQEVLPHVFEPFLSTKPIKREGKSRCGGLGLALCRDLVEENGGTISVDSQQGVGTTFSIRLRSSFRSKDA